jgi:hypothetical protein
MTLNANALTTLATAKDFLEIAVSNTSQDTRIERFINAASAMIEQYCSRRFKVQTFIEVHDGRSSQSILLHNWPAQKPSEVNIDPSWAFGPSTALAVDTFTVMDNGWLTLRSSIFPRGVQNIKITYQAGYSTVPADLEEIALMLVEYLYQHRNDRRSGIKSKSKSGENIAYMETIPPNITSLLGPYIRTDFPHSDSVVENT